MSQHSIEWTGIFLCSKYLCLDLEYFAISFFAVSFIFLKLLLVLLRMQMQILYPPLFIPFSLTQANKTNNQTH